MDSNRVIVSVSLSREEAMELKRAMQAEGETNRSDFIRKKVIYRLNEFKRDRTDDILDEIRSLSAKITAGGFQVGQYQPMAVGSYIDEDLKQDFSNIADFFSFATSGDE